MTELIDISLYNGERELLALRTGILSDVVDRFVLIEGTHTFQGDQRLPSREVEFLVDTSMGTPRQREQAQRDWRVPLPDDAIVMMSDIDEIPDPKVLRWLRDNFDPSEFYALEQAWHVNYLNVRVLSEHRWVGTTICSAGNYRRHGAQALRHASGMVTLRDAGWHWSFLGGADEVKRKIRSYARNEHNTQEIFDRVEQRLADNVHPTGREQPLVTLDLDAQWHSQVGRYHYSDYVLENRDALAHLIRL